MHLRGSYLINRLLRGGNMVVKIGPLVIKRVAGTDARRKYSSEIIARKLLRQVDVDVVPVVARIGFVNVIVMQKAIRPTLDYELDEAKLVAFEEHVLDIAQRSLPAAAPSGYYWIDSARRRLSHASFREFLIEEFALVEPFLRPQLHHQQIQAVKAILHQVDATPARIVIPTDIAPKNVVYAQGRFFHLDLEVALVGPADFLLVKAAVNLATDLGDSFNAPRVRRSFLRSCTSASAARGSLVFSLARRMMYEARVKRHDPRPRAALGALLEGASLEESITQLEGKWQNTGAFTSAP